MPVMNVHEAQRQCVRALVKILAAVPVIALESTSWNQARATENLVGAIYAFGGTLADVEDALAQGREHLRRWRSGR